MQNIYNEIPYKLKPVNFMLSFEVKKEVRFFGGYGGGVETEKKGEILRGYGPDKTIWGDHHAYLL